MLPHSFLVEMARDYGLSPEQQEVFLLLFAGHLSYEEAASQLSISMSACVKRMGEVYKKFGISGSGRGKSGQLLNFLNEQFQRYGVSATSDSDLTAQTDWQQVCRTMLEAQRRLTTNLLMAGEDTRFELDEIYVPMGLVKRKRRDRRSGDISPEQRSQLYEPANYNITRTFDHDEFFEQVLRQDKSNKIFIIGEPGAGKSTLLREQVLRRDKSNKIAIIGEPGAGKTTLLQRIAFWVLENENALPIWISLRNLWRKTVGEYLLQDWLPTAVMRVTPEIEADLQKQLTEGRVWLLLDGLDEIRDYGINPLSTISQQLAGWVGEARIVLTCRLNVWEADLNPLEEFDVYRILEFSQSQVEQFINGWFGKIYPEQGQLLCKALDEPGKERIRDLVKNPVRLALMCYSWQLRQGELPQTKAAFYQQFVAGLHQWNKNHFPITLAQQKELTTALGRLALQAINEECFRFRLPQRLVCEKLGAPDSDQSFMQMALQLGWLDQVGVATEDLDEPVYAFLHSTLQEYFAALAINDWHFFLNHVPHHPAQGTYRIFEPQWKEVILLWLGREDIDNQQKDEFIKALVEFEDGCQNFYRYRAYFLAAASIAEFSDCSLSDEIVAQIKDWGFDNPDPLRQGARAALAETAQTRIGANLNELLHTSQEQDNLRQAVESVGQIGADNQNAISALVELIHTTQDESIGKQAAESLGQIGSGNATAITALMELLHTSQDEDILRQVAESLGQIDPGNVDAINILIYLVRASQNENIRRQAAESLKKILSGNLSALAVASLKDYLQDQYCYEIIWYCAQNLPYPSFYQAWNGEDFSDQALETQITDIASQLQPTDKTYPIVINAHALEGETETDAIAQELCNQIYLSVFPDDPDIPEVSNAPQLKRLIPQIKKRLQRQHLALIMYQCEPYPELITFCHKLTDVLHIAWITNQALEYPFRSFSPEQANLLSALQNLIKESGYGNYE